jgi:hypothetical protein
VLAVLCQGANFSYPYTIDYLISITPDKIFLALLFAILLLAAKYQARLILLSLFGCIIYSNSLYYFPQICFLWTNQSSNNVSQQFDKHSYTVLEEVMQGAICVMVVTHLGILGILGTIV